MTILIAHDPHFTLTPARLMEIGRAVPGAEVLYEDCARLSPGSLARADVIFGAPEPASLPKAVCLKWLHLSCAGIERYTDPSLYTDRSVIITRSRGVCNVPMAEHALSLMLALGRGLPEYIAAQHEGIWNDRGDALELCGANVCIAGYGAVGDALGRLLVPFSCRVTGISRFPRPKPDYIDALLPSPALDSVLRDADYVACTLPLTPETKGLFGRERFSLFKRGSVFINVGRGALVDTDALTEALALGRPAFAGLDVADPEPLPPEHPLWRTEGVVITPHVSGRSVHTSARRFALFMDLLARYLEGRRLPGEVDFGKGY